jgi:hypothetical protein
LGKQQQRNGANSTKDKEHKVLPNKGGTTRDNATHQCNEGQCHEKGRVVMALGAIKGAKTKKKRGMTGSGDG